MDFDDILTQAENEPAPTRTVQVCVNPSIARDRARLLQDLKTAQEEDEKAAKADQRLAAPEQTTSARAAEAAVALHELDAEVSKSLISLRFSRLDGKTWAQMTSANPIRFDVPLDRHYGYNFDAVSELAARASGVRVDDEGEHPLSEEQWDRLYKVLAGHDVRAIVDAVWTLNEYEPEQHIAALVKGSGAA